jgi:hypothetical protein
MSEDTKHRRIVGAAKTFWDIVDRVSGKGPRRKVGSGLTAAGLITLLVDLVADGGLSWLYAIPAGVGTVVGLFLRFKGKKGVAPTEEEVVQTVQEAQAIDIEELDPDTQLEVADACGLTIDQLVKKVNLVTASAGEVARKIGDRVAKPFEAMKQQVEANKGDPRCLSKKDRMLWDVLQFAGALKIKETVEEPA